MDTFAGRTAAISGTASEPRPVRPHLDIPTTTPQKIATHQPQADKSYSVESMSHPMLMSVLLRGCKKGTTSACAATWEGEGGEGGG